MMIQKKLITNGWTVQCKLRKMKEVLGFKAKGRKTLRSAGIFELREAATLYATTRDLDSGDTFSWDQHHDPKSASFQMKTDRLRPIYRHFIASFLEVTVCY